ncbi:nitrous oxide reductase family maturation protein NosD [Methanosarcina sp. MTP4]|uniref:right-handed parallel beta-helix repeat-containing protein n=1 Tax=Methanosarcina sp. MTP4 TaxID=1434100 RepID=UPI001E414B0D|nr:NosD domain-containing protein [Methanosarcina sp. MTP4]
MLTLTIGASFPGAAETLMVDPSGGGDYTEVQAAIDAANPGDTILVKSGTYEENLKVDKELKIWSDSRNPGDTIIQAADPAKNVVEINTDRVTFSGFGISGSENSGVYFEGAGNCLINNNEISNTGQGIFLKDSDRNVVSNNVLSLNELGIRLEASGKNTIQTNVIAYNYRHGISLEESSENQIYDNYFKNSENVEENSVNQDNFWDIALTSKKNIVRGPYIAGNFWADLEGAGYSETCTDENSNGICDSPYSVNGGGTDGSPLYPKVPEAIPVLEDRMDTEAYEEGLAEKGEAVPETEPGAEISEEGMAEEGMVEEEVDVEEGVEGAEPKAEDEEAAGEEEENGAPGFGFGVAGLATGTAYLLKRRR